MKKAVVFVVAALLTLKDGRHCHCLEHNNQKKPGDGLFASELKSTQQKMSKFEIGGRGKKQEENMFTLLCFFLPTNNPCVQVVLEITIKNTLFFHSNTT